MNAAEHFFCSSSLWRYLSAHKVLPWVLSGATLGDQLLEIGAGYGPATAYLNNRVSSLTSLEYDHDSALKLKLQTDGTSATVCGDASRLPFARQTFSSAVAILILHHLESPQLQDQMFAEVFRVLRPGGTFLALEIPDRWFHRVGHIHSTFIPIAPSSVSQRLSSAGFSKVTVDARTAAFRFSATRPAQWQPRPGSRRPSPHKSVRVSEGIIKNARPDRIVEGSQPTQGETKTKCKTKAGTLYRLFRAALSSLLV
jgi:SAM-dependent methyltransferase